MDDITAGLDFGTHQTKICMKTYPNEDFKHPIYEFFKFKTPEGKYSYFLPSVVQINQDDTLSYGFVDLARRKLAVSSDADASAHASIDFDVNEVAASLYKQYASSFNSVEDIPVLTQMLELYKQKINDSSGRQDCQPATSDSEWITQQDPNYFQYFKQATFAQRNWKHEISAEYISIWYLSYVIFLLEHKYGTDFHINMGIPVSCENYDEKRMYATTILLSAYNLVEEVYANNLNEFLSETVEELLNKTQIIFASERLKNEYVINIYPEAYAGLTTLTEMGKLSKGMSLLADIGGGTTDISFFTLSRNKPVIYRYWSIPKGLNFIAEASHMAYDAELLGTMATDKAVDEFFQEENKVISQLFQELLSQLIAKTRIPRSNLFKALKDRPLVYNGGGSTILRLVQPIHYFSDIKLMDASMWKETNIVNKRGVTRLCQLLTTAYGLSIGRNDKKEVTLGDFSTLLPELTETYTDNPYNAQHVDKDCC